jgi:hypothetical protein
MLGRLAAVHRTIGLRRDGGRAAVSCTGLIPVTGKSGHGRADQKHDGGNQTGHLTASLVDGGPIPMGLHNPLSRRGSRRGKRFSIRPSRKPT